MLYLVMYYVNLVLCYVISRDVNLVLCDVNLDEILIQIGRENSLPKC